MDLKLDVAMLFTVVPPPQPFPFLNTQIYTYKRKDVKRLMGCEVFLRDSILLDTIY